MKLDRQEAGSGGFLQYHSILRQRNPAGAHALYIPPAQRILHIPTQRTVPQQRIEQIKHTRRADAVML